MRMRNVKPGCLEQKRKGESVVYLYSWSIFFIAVNDCEVFEERPK